MPAFHHLQGFALLELLNVVCVLVLPALAAPTGNADPLLWYEPSSDGTLGNQRGSPSAVHAEPFDQHVHGDPASIYGLQPSEFTAHASQSYPPTPHTAPAFIHVGASGPQAVVHGLSMAERSDPSAHFVPEHGTWSSQEFRPELRASSPQSAAPALNIGMEQGGLWTPHIDPIALSGKHQDFLPLTLAERHSIAQAQAQAQAQWQAVFQRFINHETDGFQSSHFGAPQGAHTAPISGRGEITSDHEAVLQDANLIPAQHHALGTSQPHGDLEASTSYAGPEPLYAHRPDIVYARSYSLGPQRARPRTALQSRLKQFVFPPESSFLKPNSNDNKARFYGAIQKGSSSRGLVRYVSDPDLIKKVSLVNLSGVKLMGPRDVWNTLNLRFMFAQSQNVAYGIVDAQLLKDVFPSLPREDLMKLQDGFIAIIEVTKPGKKGYDYRLFSLLDPGSFRMLKL